MSFVIATDSTANLDKKYTEENNITVIPLTYLCGTEEKICLVPDNFDDVSFYNSIKNGNIITTSQINPKRYIDYLEPLLIDENDILFITVSSGISGSFSSSQIAKKELLEKYTERKIELVDSLAASLGEGILVMEAVKCRNNEMNISETKEYLESKREEISQIFFVDDLMHLKRTGRLSGGIAIVGSILGVKPILKGNEYGKIVTCGKTRGRAQAIKNLAERYFNNVCDAASQTVAITYCNCKADAEYLKSLIMEKLPPMNIIIQKHEPVTGSHLGPGALALYFRGEKNIRLHN